MSARDIAFEVLRRVEEGGAYASRALDAALARAGRLDPREAALATELVYGTLRRIRWSRADVRTFAGRLLSEPVRARLDETRAARKPILRWRPGMKAE